ncbi:hypothetical protein [Maribellus maritimus]|uniref:hypothetical protein n=1 Tax=Maribellus maritimus TaxID=2870838 RepID=UPI001EEB6A5D|nr:hypothetical protein [Maribellus maritimus]MCG6191041.1 hypothetical protein [Maribellus maritimus]
MDVLGQRVAIGTMAGINGVNLFSLQYKYLKANFITIFGMKKRILTIIILIFSINTGYSQIIIPILFGEEIVPEHGFLPGRKFPIYKTINAFDFNAKSFRVELIDDRSNSQLRNIRCSSLDIENTSELASAQTIFKLKEYVDSVFSQSNLNIDSTATSSIVIKLQAIDSRITGFGKIKVHGLCQLKISVGSSENIYCCDIVDGDENAPLGSNAIVTRKTASRFMASAAIRECLEQFLFDLKEN